MFDVIEYVKRNGCTIIISPIAEGQYFLTIENEDGLISKTVTEITFSLCDELLAELRQKKALENNVKRIAKQLRDVEAFFKGI